MKVKETKSEGLSKEYSITVAAAAISDRVNSRLKAMSGRVKIPGFRPGHVPMQVLQQRFGKSVMGEVLENAIRQAVQDVVKQQNLRPVLQPEITVTQYEEGGDLTFSMTLENFPDVPETNFSKITLERFTFDVNDNEVEEGLNRLAQRNKQIKKTKEGTRAAKGNVVLIDFKGKLNGEPFEGGEARRHHLELGSNQFIPGFEDELVGVKAGDELTIKVTFPKDYHNADLAGKPVEFDVAVHEVYDVSTPAVDDEFAKSHGMKDLDEFRKAVREQIVHDYEQVARNRLKRQLFDWLEENCEFDVPKRMVDMEFDSIWKRLLEAKKQGDPSLNRPEEELKEEYRRIAERRVRLGLYLAEIGNRNNLQVTQDELTHAIMNQARQFPGNEKKVLEFYRKNPQQVEDLRGPILEEKAVDFILGKVTLKDRKVTTEELLSEEEGDAGSTSGSKSKPQKAAKEKGGKKKSS